MMARFGRLIVTFFLLIVSNCTYVTRPNVLSERQYTEVYLSFSNRMSDEQIQDFLSGISIWNNSLANEFILRIVDDVSGLDDDNCEHKILVNVTRHDDILIIENDIRKNIKTLALATNHPCGISRIWLVYDRLQTRFDFSNVSAHEFAHTFGVKHILNDSALMRKNYSSMMNEICLTNDDLDVMCNYISCDVKLLMCD